MKNKIINVLIINFYSYTHTVDDPVMGGTELLQEFSKIFQFLWLRYNSKV